MIAERGLRILQYLQSCTLALLYLYVRFMMDNILLMLSVCIEFCIVLYVTRDHAPS